MKLVIIFGPQAVGKMTVGHELEKITDLKLLHNHMTIDLVDPFVCFGTDEGRGLVRRIRGEILKEVAAGDSAGIIFTYLWNFETEFDSEYIKEISNIFESKGGEVCLIELEADVDTRLERNRTEHRLIHKPSKKDFKRSEGYLLDAEAKSRNNSLEGEIKNSNYMRIKNTNVTPNEAAKTIKDKFKL
jgi:tRNA uridine 5-carbamoylmethylation protein Kti12